MFVSLLGIYYNDSRMFYLCYLFLYVFLCEPLGPRTSEWMACGYVMDSWGYGEILICAIGFFASSPCFLGDGEIVPNFTKYLTVPSFG